MKKKKGKYKDLKEALIDDLEAFLSHHFQFVVLK